MLIASKLPGRLMYEKCNASFCCAMWSVAYSDLIHVYVCAVQKLLGISVECNYGVFNTLHVCVRVCISVCVWVDVMPAAGGWQAGGVQTMVASLSWNLTKSCLYNPFYTVVKQCKKLRAQKFWMKFSPQSILIECTVNAFVPLMIEAAYSLSFLSVYK